MIRKMHWVMVVLVFVLAGCGDITKNALPDDPVIDSGYGGVVGIVVSDESMLISGATVTLTPVAALSSIQTQSRKVTIASILASKGTLDEGALTTTSNTCGEFTFNRVPPGEYRLSASTGNLARSQASISVQQGKATNAGVIVLKNTGKVQGEIDIDLTDNNSMVLVVLLGTSLLAYTDASGHYTIYNVPAGTYDLAVSKVGYLDIITNNISVAPDTTVTIPTIVLYTNPDEGQQEVAGISWKGTLASAPSNPQLNWAYYNSTEGISYIYDGNAWQILAINGQSGADGQDGQDGTGIVWKGSLTTHPENPSLNWAYYNPAMGTAYIYDGTSWQVMAVDGQDGQDGTPYNIDSPRGFVAAVSNAHVSLRWENPANCHTVLIRKRTDQYPESIFDGEEVFTGRAESCSDALDIDASGTIYYSLWAADSNSNWSVAAKAAVTVSGEWVYVGNPGLTAGTAQKITMQFSEGTPYLAYRDQANKGKASVMTYNGRGWVTVGTAGFSAGSVLHVSLALAPDGTPYVAIIDQSYQPTVMMYNGSAWVTVGTAGFSAGSTNKISMAFAPDGTPYVAFTDSIRADRITVMTYNGSAWVAVGSAGFSYTPAENLSIVISPDGTPYVAYRDSQGYAGVMTYNGSEWVTVGIRLTTSEVFSLSMAIAPDGTPYVAFIDQSYQPISMMYNGSDWVTVGTAGFFSRPVYEVHMAIASDGAPYVSYVSGDGLYRLANVMRYDGSSWTSGRDWTSVGMFNPEGEESYFSFALSPKGIPWYAFADFSVGLTAMKLAY